MSELEIVTAAAEKIRARYLAIPRLSIPLSLRDDRDRLVAIRPVQSKEMALAQFKTWIEDGWRLYQAASQGILPKHLRGKGLAANASKAFIEDNNTCNEVQRAFKETIVPAARELLAAGADIPMSKDVRDYLGK